jgi:hypothetical protein
MMHLTSSNISSLSTDLRTEGKLMNYKRTSPELDPYRCVRFIHLSGGGQAVRLLAGADDDDDDDE